jgi:hypothetical protein
VKRFFFPPLNSLTNTRNSNLKIPYRRKSVKFLSGLSPLCQPPSSGTLCGNLWSRRTVLLYRRSSKRCLCIGKCNNLIVIV